MLSRLIVAGYNGPPSHGYPARPVNPTAAAGAPYYSTRGPMPQDSPQSGPPGPGTKLPL